MDFTDKVAVVTGGGKGIGRACVLGFAREGAAVVIVDTDEEAVKALAEGIASWGGRALALVADVSQEFDAARIAAETSANFGGVDVLVNNAGIQTYGTVETTSLEQWNRTLAVNLTGAYLVSRFIIPELRRRGGGAIVNIASVQGIATEANVAAYAASKGAILALTRTMALDYAAESIRVNSVCPGSIDTPMLRESAHNDLHQRDDLLAEWGKLHPIGRVGHPEEVAEVVLFLASSRASFVTGAAYLVDGGLLSKF